MYVNYAYKTQNSERNIFMKNLAKLLALVLAMLCVFSTLVACDANDKEEETNAAGSQAETALTDENETTTEFFPDVKKQDYGADFNLMIQPQSNRVDYYWVEESNNDALSEAIYTRQQQVYDYLGVEITATIVDGHDKYGTPFMTAVKNKDGSVDSLLSHAYMFLASFIQNGYLMDYNDIDGIDLDADYWSLDVMEGVAAGDHLYLGYSDFRLAHTAVIAFNKQMLAKYEDALEESIYETVQNYRWTVDKMISLANLVYIDKTSDGKTDDDTFGITGTQWYNFIGFTQASGIQLVAQNERGEYVVNVYTNETKERTTALVEKLLALSKSDCTWFNYKEDATKNINITSNQTLLSLEYIISLPGYLSYDVEFGVVPYPMFDEAQKDLGYRSLDFGGWICVPSYVEDMNKVSDTLEMLAFFSEDVTITFYEKILGKQVADAPEDRAMLDIVWDSVCSDIGLTYSHITESLDINLYMLPNVTHANTTEALASYVSSYEKSANKKLAQYFKVIQNK